MESKIISGDLKRLPERQTNTVRVFLSSTFTDHSVERNKLMREAVPQLRDYCQDRGLDFQLSDMRWGVTDDAQDDHGTTDLCLHEIESCQRHSRGPYFACFVGNKYGYRPYPRSIVASEFETLFECAKQLGKDTKLLSEWYWLDTNSLPNEYVVQPITSKFPHYNDDSPENKDKKASDREQWYAVDEKLTDLFRAAADEAFRQDLISADVHHSYFRSVTENEIDVGLLSADDVRARTLYFERTIKDFNYKDAKAKRHIDMVGGQVDEEAKSLLEQLKQEKIPGVLDGSNTLMNTIRWDPEGVNPDVEEHATYLQRLVDYFITEVKRLVDLELSKVCSKESDELVTEVLHHSLMVGDKAKVFCGREEVVAEVRERSKEVFSAETAGVPTGDADEKEGGRTELKTADGGDGEPVTNMAKVMEASESKRKEQEKAVNAEQKQLRDALEEKGVKYAIEDSSMGADGEDMQSTFTLASFTKPLVIHGRAGNGKTSLMAHLAEQIDRWAAPRKPVKVIRFLGTSRASTILRDLMASLITQIAQAYGLNSSYTGGGDLNTMSMFFRHTLSLIDVSERPLYILLDSLDQLSLSDQAHSMRWLPVSLPVGVHLIVSTIGEPCACLSNLRLRLPDPARFVEVGDMPAGEAEELLARWLQYLGRSVTEEQRGALMAAYVGCPQPLYLRLSLQVASTWYSYTPVSEGLLGDTVVAAINLLLDKLEVLHGKTLSSRALAYLTASNGLSDGELEDILTLDDEVLQDTYVYHLPPDGDHIRLAPSLWRRIRYELEEYLVERDSHGRDTIFWYHSQFSQAIQQRYLSGEDGIKAHYKMVEYFTGMWAGKVKPLELYKGKKASYPNAYRAVPHQPLIYGTNRPNQRKLAELPTHLVRSHQFEWFVEKICRSFEWLRLKSLVQSVHAVLRDLELALSELEQMGAEGGQKYEAFVEEIKLLLRCLRMGSQSIRNHPQSLAVQLLGQLPPDSSKLTPGLQILQAQMLEWVNTTDVPLLVPRTQCLPPPTTAVKISIDLTIYLEGDNPFIEDKLALKGDGQYLYAVSRSQTGKGDDIKVYDINHNAEVIIQEKIGKMEFKSIRFVGNDKYLLCEVYIQRDEFSPKLMTYLVDQSHTEVAFIPHGAHIHCVSTDGNLCLIQVTNDNGHELVILDMQEEKELRRLRDLPPEECLFALFSPDSSCLAVVTGKAITLWDVKTGGRRHTLTADDDSSFGFSHYADFGKCTHFLPGDRLLGRGLSYKSHSKLFVWDVVSGGIVHELAKHSYQVDLVGLSSSKRRAVSGSKDTSTSSDCGPKWFRIWDLDSGEELAHSSTEGPFQVLSFLGDHEDLIVASTRFNPTAILWKLKEGELLPVFEVLAHNKCVVFSECTRDSQLWLTASLDNNVTFWSLSEVLSGVEELLKRYPTKEAIEAEIQEMKKKPAEMGTGRMQTVNFTVSKDGKTAALGTADGWILFYDLVSNKIKACQHPDDESVHHLITTSNGKYFVSAGKSIYVWDASTGEESSKLEAPIVHGRAARASALAESCDLLVAAYGGMECYGNVYNLETGEKIHSLSGLYGFGNVAITHDGKKVVTSMFDFPMVFDLSTGQAVSSLEKNDTMMSGCTCITISPDDHFAGVGSSDGAMRVYDLVANDYRFRFQHRSTVTTARFTPDSRLLVTCCFSSILVWSLSAGRLQNRLGYHKNFVTDLVFCCQGNVLLTCSHDKRLVVWDFPGRRTLGTSGFQAHCALNKMGAADDLSSVLFCPMNVAYLGLLRPNPALCRLLGDLRSGPSLPPALAGRAREMTGLALTFSTTRGSSKQSAACQIL